MSNTSDFDFKEIKDPIHFIHKGWTACGLEAQPTDSHTGILERITCGPCAKEVLKAINEIKEAAEVKDE